MKKRQPYRQHESNGGMYHGEGPAPQQKPGPYRQGKKKDFRIEGLGVADKRNTEGDTTDNPNGSAEAVCPSYQSIDTEQADTAYREHEPTRAPQWGYAGKRRHDCRRHDRMYNGPSLRGRAPCLRGVSRPEIGGHLEGVRVEQAGRIISIANFVSHVARLLED